MINIQRLFVAAQLNLARGTSDLVYVSEYMGANTPICLKRE